MLERQDIDALLIGALYGELTPADEARLNAHLDSHPADKTALADLTTARNAVRESRFLTVQIEPPQAVSALLLQEASRRAPAKAKVADDKKEGWFARFVSSFVRHPAMAAAAMLVVVVGVAGTMYLRNGDKQFAEQSTSTFGGNEAAAPAAATADRGPVDEAKDLKLKAGSGFEATLAEEGAAQPADKQDAFAARSREQASEKKEAADGAVKEAPKAEPAPPAKPTTTRTYIGVQTTTPQPKELEQDNAGFADDSRRSKGAAGSPGGGAAPPAVTRNERAPVVATPAPPPPPPAQTAPRGAGNSVTVGGATGGEDSLSRDAKDAKPSPDEGETTWAREQAVKVSNAVKANNCKEAASLAVQLSTRSPAFYQQNVENDRDLKKCMTYINAEREKEAERAQRAKALQKREAEPAPRRAAPTTTNTK